MNERQQIIEEHQKLLQQKDSATTGRGLSYDQIQMKSVSDCGYSMDLRVLRCIHPKLPINFHRSWAPWHEINTLFRHLTPFRT